ncbi:MAG: NAD(P)-dependent oxidoreductase [Sneathiellaceae bacterium]
MQVGFVGIGNMGWPMAANLVAAGHDLVVHDTTAGLAGRFAAEVGGRAAASLAEVGACEAVVTMLPTGAIVRQVLTEAENGAFAAALRPGTVVVDMSSAEPVGTKALGPVLAGRGAVLLDAPVSGGVARAKTGELAIMIGGDDEAAIERATPLLQAMGGRLFRTGGLGSGHAMKALNNMVAAASYVATAEAMLIGRRFGLDAGTMVEIMNVSTGRNFHTDIVMKEHVVGEKYATGFAVGLLAKDVKIAADLGRQMKLDAPLSRLTEERWATARDKLGFAADNSAAITVLESDLEG